MNSTVLIIAVVLIGVIFYIFNRKSKVGYTFYKSTGVRHEFAHVDLENQRVTCIVTYKGKIYMTAVVDVKTNTVEVDGNLDSLGDKAMGLHSYVDMFKYQAKYFIDNGISNPRK